MAPETPLPWKLPSLEPVHAVKIGGMILRVLVLLAVLVATAMLLLHQDDDTLAIRQTINGLMTDSTCFFMSKDLGSLETGGAHTYCGRTAAEMASEVYVVRRTLNSTGFMEACLPNLMGDCDCEAGMNQRCPGERVLSLIYVAQFLGPVLLGSFFMCTYILVQCRSMFRNQKVQLELFSPKVDLILGEAWSFILLTLLPQYLMQPIASVQVLPAPADKVVMLRTPPDYAFLMLWSIFVIGPFTLSLLCNCHQLAGEPERWSRCFLVSIFLSVPVAVLVPLGYLWMGNFLFIEWSFDFSFQLSFVWPAMLAKLLLGILGILDTLAFVQKLLALALSKQEAPAPDVPDATPEAPAAAGL